MNSWLRWLFRAADTASTNSARHAPAARNSHRSQRFMHHAPSCPPAGPVLERSHQTEPAAAGRRAVTVSFPSSSLPITVCRTNA